MCFNFVYCSLGDALDRFLSRVFDMRNALLIVKQSLFWFICFGCLGVLFFVISVDVVIEKLIYVFYMCWCICVPGLTFVSVEHPKGEYCVCLLCFLFSVCSRARIRCCDFLCVLLLDVLCRGFLLSDLCVVIGNLDVVFGSVDR